MIRSTSIASLLAAILVSFAVVSIALAQDGATGSSGGGTTQPPPPPPADAPRYETGIVPPPQGSGFDESRQPPSTPGQINKREGQPYMSDQNMRPESMPQPRPDQMYGNQDGNMRGVQDRMGEEMSDERRKKMEERQKAQMLKQADRMSKMFVKQLSQYKAQVAKLEKTGIKMSSSCSNAMTLVTTLSEKAKSISDPDEIQELFDEAAEAQHTLMECKMVVSKLSQLPSITKTLNTMVTRLEKAEVDVTDYKAEMSRINNAYSQIKAGSLSHDDIEDFFADLFGLGQELRSEYLDQGFSLPKGLPMAPPQQMENRGPMMFLQKASAQFGSVILAVLPFLQ